MISRKHLPKYRKTKAGQSALKLLIKSGPLERETRKRVHLESTEEIGSERSDRVGNTEGKRPEESPRG